MKKTGIINKLNITFNSEKDENNLIIFPNPIKSNKLNIKTNKNNLSFKLFDITGNCIQEGLLKNKKQIDLFNIQNGVYVLNLYEKDIIISFEKVIILR